MQIVISIPADHSTWQLYSYESTCDALTNQNIKIYNHMVRNLQLTFAYQRQHEMMHLS